MYPEKSLQFKTMYADDTAVLFPVSALKGIPLQTTFQTLWGRNSSLKGKNKSKSECLFVSKKRFDPKMQRYLTM